MPSLQTRYPVARRWQRFSLQVPVRLVVHRTAQVDCINGNGLELNEGGMCLFAGIEMRTGEQVTVEFTPPSAADPLRIWAAVRNRRGNYYGLEFLAENTGERAQVARYRDDLRTATQPN
jgi:hypothetical protein